MKSVHAELSSGVGPAGNSERREMPMTPMMSSSKLVPGEDETPGRGVQKDSTVVHLRNIRRPTSQCEVPVVVPQ